MSAPDLLAGVAAAHRRHDLFPPEGTIVVAVSGGPDSIVLLHLLAEYFLDRPVRLVVAHLDHQLRPEAADEAAFVARQAASLGLTAVLRACDAGAVATACGWSVEEAGRRVRYAFLADVAEEVGASTVATAHHADDQVETILLNLIRGTGLAGLAGMRIKADFPLSRAQIAEVWSRLPGRERNVGASARSDAVTSLPIVVRPLLQTDRSAILAYARANALDFVRDSSNHDTRYTRNRVRHEIVPALEAVNPQVRQALLRLSEIARDEDDFLQWAADSAWAAIARPSHPPPAGSNPPTTDAVSLEFAPLLALHRALARRLIRRAAEAAGADLRALGPEHVDRVLSAASEGGAVALPGGTSVVRRGAFLEFEPTNRAPLQPPPPLVAHPLRVPGRLDLPGGWSLTASVRSRNSSDSEKVAEPWRAVMDADAVLPLTVRGRVAGDRMTPLGMSGRTKTLQDLFVDEAVPAEQRAGWPIVLAPFGVAWVPGLRLDHRARVRAETTRVVEVEAAQSATRPHHGEPTLGDDYWLRASS